MATKLTCGVAFMRAILLILNIIFVLVGAGLIGVGIYIKVGNKFAAILDRLTQVSTFEGQSLGFLAFVLIGGGVFTILIALSGCIGSLWHNRCLLYTYAIILGILIILELIGFIMAFAYKSKLENVYKDSLTAVFTKALSKNDTKVLDAFHELERSLNCCGVNGRKDYEDQKVVAPPECFVNPNGCSDNIIDWLQKSLPIIGGTLGGVLLFELLNLVAAIILAAALKNTTDESLSLNPKDVLAVVVPGRRRNYHRVS